MFSIRYLLVQPYWNDYPDKLCNNFHYVPGIVILAISYSKRYQWLNSFSIIFSGWIWHDGKVLIFIPETNSFQKVIEEMKFQEDDINKMKPFVDPWKRYYCSELVSTEKRNFVSHLYPICEPKHVTWIYSHSRICIVIQCIISFC